MSDGRNETHNSLNGRKLLKKIGPNGGTMERTFEAVGGGARHLGFLLILFVHVN